MGCRWLRSWEPSTTNSRSQCKRGWTPWRISSGTSNPSNRCTDILHTSASCHLMVHIGEPFRIKCWCSPAEWLVRSELIVRGSSWSDYMQCQKVGVLVDVWVCFTGRFEQLCQCTFSHARSRQWVSRWFCLERVRTKLSAVTSFSTKLPAQRSTTRAHRFSVAYILMGICVSPLARPLSAIVVANPSLAPFKLRHSNQSTRVNLGSLCCFGSLCHYSDCVQA